MISQSLANDTRTLGYDAKGNITSINDANVNQLFGYDELNRLTEKQGQRAIVSNIDSLF